MGGSWATAGGLLLILGALAGANLTSGSRFGSPGEPKCSPKGPSWRPVGASWGPFLDDFLDFFASFFAALFWYRFFGSLCTFGTNFASNLGSILCHFYDQGLDVSTPRKRCACRSDQGSGGVENVIKCVKKQR